MAVNDIYNVQYFMLHDDKEVCVNQVYRETVARNGTIAQATVQLAADRDNIFWTTFWQPFASDELTYVKTVAQMIFPTREAPFINTSSAGQAGADIGASMNGTTAVLISEYASTWSANFRGRMYLPGLRESNATDGRLLAATLATIQSSYETQFQPALVLVPPADVTFQMQVYSPTRAAVPTLPVSSDFITAIVRPRIATQRRRRTPVLSPS